VRAKAITFEPVNKPNCLGKTLYRKTSVKGIEKTMVSRIGKFKRLSEPKRIGKFVRAAVAQHHGR
jgi:hypothetical protein